MLRSSRPALAFFESIKALRVRQLAMILKAGYDPNLMVNARGQNGLQFLINYFGATEAHYRLQAPINKSAYLSIAKLLLDSGLDPNALDLLADETVLFDAIRYNDKEMVALLLNYVDPSLRNKNGETALMCAARFGSKATVRLLLEHLHHLDLDGYFLRQRNRFGLSPLEIARSENLDAAKAITKHLIAYGPHAPGALLAGRSVSHHSLAALDARRATSFRSPVRAETGGAGGGGCGGPGSQRAARARAPLVPAELLLDECISASDYDSDVMAAAAAAAAAAGRRPTLLEATPAPRRLAFNSYQAYYDPRAAEFSQYLLEQQQQQQQQQHLHHQKQQQQQQYQGYAAASRRAGFLSDDDQDAEAEFVPRAGPLLRSRSCMLGPAGAPSSAGAGQSGAGPAAGPAGLKGAKLDQGAGPGKLAGASWQDQSSGDAGGRQ